MALYQATTATKKVLSLNKRIRAIQGGTSASKTISVLLVLIHLAQSDKTPTLTSVVSESFPHLKRGVIRDFLAIMQAHEYFQDANWNKTDYIYTFATGSKIEFFSADQPSKVRGPRRDRLFINEANNIPFEAFEQLEVRTKDFIFLDWNPTNEYWFYTNMLGQRDDIDHIILTYKDNEALDERIVKTIEARKNRKNWWKVYGLGELGDVESKIYKNWQIIDAVPPEARLLRYGLDFGYTNDPSAIIAVYAYNGGFIFDEIFYATGASNRELGDVLKTLDKAITYADSAEPKSIDELRSFGLSVIGSFKGKGSVKTGIQYIQDQSISVTKRSLNVIKEYRNYLWITDDNGKILNEPEGGNDHALDACRYALEPEIGLRKSKTKISTPTYAGYS